VVGWRVQGTCLPPVPSTCRQWGDGACRRGGDVVGGDGGDGQDHVATEGESCVVQKNLM
jgi:hypothetical protein